MNLIYFLIFKFTESLLYKKQPEKINLQQAANLLIQQSQYKFANLTIPPPTHFVPL